MVSCGVFMEIRDGRVLRLIGDKDDPASHGYTCSKGRDIATHLYGPQRLLQPLRRNETSTFDAISPDQAIAEIAACEDHAIAGAKKGTGRYKGARGHPVR